MTTNKLGTGLWWPGRMVRGETSIGVVHKLSHAPGGSQFTATMCNVS